MFTLGPWDRRWSAQNPTPPPLPLPKHTVAAASARHLWGLPLLLGNKAALATAQLCEEMRRGVVEGSLSLITLPP